MKDAYYSIPVKSEDQKYLHFKWADQFYEFTCLPDGLSCAPRQFTKILKPPLAALHKQGHISIIAHLDDLYLQSRTYDDCVKNVIAGFHCHTIIKPIQQINSRIKEIKEDEYSNSLTKVQVCAIFRARDIRRNVLLKFIRLCMETPCLCPSQGHKYGVRKLTKTYVIEFCYKKPVVVF